MLKHRWFSCTAHLNREQQPLLRHLVCFRRQTTKETRGVAIQAHAHTAADVRSALRFYQRTLIMPANKYQRWSSTMFRRGDTTEAVGEDVIDLVATFASCRDLCTLGRVCRRFGPVSVRESLWELRALDILPSRPQLHSAMAKLHLVSYRQLVEAFTRIGIPGGVLGFWSAEAPTRSWAAQLELSSRLLSSPSLERPTLEEREARGELLRISLSARGFLCESIAPDGTSRW